MRILFASTAADGHFNPMTGVAIHLRDAGHDVRWYTGASYEHRLQEMGIPLLPFKRAREINGETMPKLFPERARLKGPALIPLRLRTGIPEQRRSLFRGCGGDRPGLLL